MGYILNADVEEESNIFKLVFDQPCDSCAY